MEGKNLDLISRMADTIKRQATEAEQSMVTFTSGDLTYLRSEYFCPHRHYRVRVTGEYTEPLSESEMKRAYFRYKTVGLLLENGERPDLPKIRGGKDSADQKRLDEQAAEFMGHLAAHDFHIEQYVEPVKLIYNDHVILKETLPAIISMPDGKGGRKQAVLYPEATGNLHSTFGDRCWGNYWLMDHTTAYFMAIVQKILSGQSCDFVYAVYEYSTRMDHDFIDVMLDALNESELRERIRKAYIKHTEAAQEGWQPRPRYEACKDCPVTDCQRRELVKPIKTITPY
jgi:hypothetical protein